ncbi:MAG TPA: glycosyltransferase, partial [Rudaea sp.]
AGRLCMRMHRLDLALAFLQRAVEIDPNTDALAEYDACCELLFRSEARRSAGRMLAGWIERLNARAANAIADERFTRIHIVSRLDALGGTERRALNLYHQLARSARVTLWSTAPALPFYSESAPVRQIGDDATPSGGTLILVGTYYPCGDWLEHAAFDRIVICHNLAEQYWTLSERLLQLENNRSHPCIELTCPSQLFRAESGLPARIEYGFVDTGLFRRRAAAHAGGPIRIGRHARAYALKFHPNDPHFFRELGARGYVVSLLGGSVLSTAFAGADSGPELLAAGSRRAEDFLQSLDIFVYRKHPKLYETGGTAILEAMATELPVVVFREDCGSAELIEHGCNGFLVDSEAEAIECIDRLAADVVLREQIGRAARATIVALMQRQSGQTLRYYLGADAVPDASGDAKRGSDRIDPIDGIVPNAV